MYIQKPSIIFFAFVFILTLNINFQGIAKAATYYVDIKNVKANDTNPGSKTLPWKTIARASATMIPGDTTIIMPGTYNEAILSAKSGTQTGRIIFKASGVVNITGANINHNYITIDGFSMTNNQIDIHNGNYCEVLNNHISKGAIQMHFLNSTQFPTKCLIKGNKLDKAASLDGDWPQIEVFGSYNIIEDNEIGPASDIDAFRLWGHHNIIRKNYVHDITYSPNTTAHMDIFQSFSLNGWSANNITIENNRFINFQGQMCMTSTDASPQTHDFIIRNNVFAHIGQNANIGIRNMYFLNNTFYDVGAFSGYKNDWGSSANTTFINNIFIGVKGYNLAYYDANLFLNPEPWIFEKNYFSTVSGAALKNFNSITQKKAINGGKINFTNVAANDYSIKSGSITIDKGKTLTGFNYDLLGNTRPQGAAWDIGAHEFKPTASTTTLLPPSNLRVQ